LYALLRPRAGELLRLLSAAPDAAACREDFGGSGVGLNDPKGTGKGVERCMQSLVRGGATLAKTRLTGIGSCLDNVFVCVEADVGNAACLAKATTRCGREFSRIERQVAKLTVSASKACAAIDFALVSGPTGGYLDAVTDVCESYGVPEVVTVTDWVACLARQQECEVADLVRFESPRAEDLLQQVGRTLVAIPCP
jgi:hypothetical protein